MHHGAAWGVVHALYTTVVVLRQFLHEITVLIGQSAQQQLNIKVQLLKIDFCWSLVSSGPWSLLVLGIQWSLVPGVSNGPW